MPEPKAAWLVEEGIAEHRAVRLEGGRIAAARVEWPGRLADGWVIEAKLASRSAGSARGTALADTGEEILVERLPRDAREGAPLRLLVTRAALDGPGRFKRAQARPSNSPPARPRLAERLNAQVVRCFATGEWDELVGEALAGEIAFTGGSLLLSPTAAMTTVDVDGSLPPRALAFAAIPALAQALHRFDLGGSVAIDFPTLADKADRRAVDEALEEALAGWPHERTAMNGFGLVQLVSRLERSSLLHRATWQRSATIWRRLLRRAEHLRGAGPIELAVHPSLEREAEPAQLAELERRTGVSVKVRKVATLALEAPHAQRAAHD